MLRSTCPVCGFKLPAPADRCPRCPTDFAEWQRTTTLSHRLQPQKEPKRSNAGIIVAILVAGGLVAGAVLWKTRPIQGKPDPAAENVKPLFGLDAPHPLVPTLAPEPTIVPDGRSYPPAQYPPSQDRAQPPAAGGASPVPASSGPEPVLYVESTEAPGVSGGGNVWVRGVVANRGDGPGCYVRVMMRVYYASGGLASSRETIIGRIDAHSKAAFESFIEAPVDLGMSDQQTGGNTVQYGREMKKMGRVDASISSFERCR